MCILPRHGPQRIDKRKARRDGKKDAGSHEKRKVKDDWQGKEPKWSLAGHLVRRIDNRWSRKNRMAGSTKEAVERRVACKMSVDG